MNTSHNTPLAGDTAATLQLGLGGATSLRAWEATPSTQVPAAGTFKLELLHLYRWTSLVTVMGKLEKLKLNWGGQQRCTLHTSIGDLPLQANRETLPPEIGNDSWVQVTLRLRRGVTDPEQSNTNLLRVVAVKLSKGDPTTAWVPTVPNHRPEHSLVKRMLVNGIDVARCTVGVLGVTFKENCPDIRNSKVVDLIRELETWGVNVQVVDPIADKAEVLHEYGLRLDEVSAEKPVDSLVVAVGHESYRSLTPTQLMALCKPGKPVLADLKSLYDRHALSHSGFTVFRL